MASTVFYMLSNLQESKNSVTVEVSKNRYLWLGYTPIKMRPIYVINITRCLKIQKKSHSTLRAKRASFSFWVDKNWLKMPNKVNLTSFFFKTWTFDQTVLPDSFNWTKIDEKCQNWVPKRESSSIAINLESFILDKNPLKGSYK